MAFSQEYPVFLEFNSSIVSFWFFLQHIFGELPVKKLMIQKAK